MDSPASPPGYSEAVKYLFRQSKRTSATKCRNENDSADGNDYDPSLTSQLHQNDFLDALMILRLHSATANMPSQPLRPTRGLLTTIIATNWVDRKRVSRMLPRVSLFRPRDKGNLEIVVEEESGHYHSIQGTFEKVEGFLELGSSTIAILSTADALSATLAVMETGRFTLPAVDRCMLTAMLEYRYPGQDIRLQLTDTQIARIPPVALGPVFVAVNADEALLYLYKIGTPRLVVTAGPTLDDVYGQPEAVGTFQRVVQDLELWKAGTLHWPDVTRSFLLHGPPGNGKSMLADALAGSAGIRLVKTSYSDCQKFGHQGDMLRALNAAANRAIVGAPACFFVDEIDSFYSRNSSENGYIIGVVNGLLTLIDRLSATDGVVLIAATNVLARIDPAIIRKGRFDRHLLVGAPDRAGIRAMLRAALR